MNQVPSDFSPKYTGIFRPKTLPSASIEEQAKVQRIKTIN